VRTPNTSRQAGGHWFEPSTAHQTKAPQSRGFFFVSCAVSGRPWLQNRRSWLQQPAWEDDLETARACLEAVDVRAESLRESWRLVVLIHLIELELRAGDPKRALQYAAEAEEIGLYWGVGHATAAAQAAAALAHAVAGSPVRARTAATTVLDAMRPHAYEIVIRPAERALGHLELALGDPSAADAVLGPLLQRAPIACPPVTAAAPDEIEALLDSAGSRKRGPCSPNSMSSRKRAAGHAPAPRQRAVPACSRRKKESSRAPPTR
jgi:hypothetical protein